MRLIVIHRQEGGRLVGYRVAPAGQEVPEGLPPLPVIPDTRGDMYEALFAGTDDN